MQFPFYKITKLIESYEKVEYNQVFFSKQDLLILINFNFKHIKSYYYKNTYACNTIPFNPFHKIPPTLPKYTIIISIYL